MGARLRKSKSGALLASQLSIHGIQINGRLALLEFKKNKEEKQQQTLKKECKKNMKGC